MLVKIGFTGTQQGMNSHQKERVEEIMRSNIPFEFHHGDCIGADKEAHDIAVKLKQKTISHPPEISSKRAFCVSDEERTPRPYLDRNIQIVKDSDFMIATPRNMEEILRSGTWFTIRYSKRIRKPIYVVFPKWTKEEECLEKRGREGFGL